MNCSRKKFCKSLLYFGKLHDKEDEYNEMLDTTFLDTLVDKVVYDLFWDNFSLLNCSKETYLNFKILKEYCEENDNNGYVEFKNK